MRRARKRFADHAVNFLQFFHQVEAGMQASGSIDKYDVTFACQGSLNGIIGHRAWIGIGLTGNHRHIQPFSPDLQLIDRGGAKSIGGRQQHFLALIGILFAQFGGGGGLSRTIYAHQQYDGRLKLVKPDERGGSRRTISSSRRASCKSAVRKMPSFFTR